MTGHVPTPLPPTQKSDTRSKLFKQVFGQGSIFFITVHALMFTFACWSVLLSSNRIQTAQQRQKLSITADQDLDDGVHGLCSSLTKLTTEWLALVCHPNDTTFITLQAIRIRAKQKITDRLQVKTQFAKPTPEVNGSDTGHTWFYGCRPCQNGLARLNLGTVNDNPVLMCELTGVALYDFCTGLL